MQRLSGPTAARRLHRRRVLTVTALVLIAALGAPGSNPARADNGEVLENSPWCSNGVASNYVPPAGQVLMGELLDWSADTPGSPRAVASGATARLGRAPAIFTTNVPFPFPDDGGATAGFLNTVADDVSHQGGILSVTLDLDQGNGAGVITPAAAATLADQLRTFNTVEGLPVLLRIGPEMNGSWDPWGQHPGTYVTAFRTIAAAVHQDPAVQTVWAPNYGGGAPWAGGSYAAQPGTADFALLDTNHDGKLTASDDPYAPYWPGADAVDWVGLSLYDFGNVYPWGPNVLPQAGRVVADISGTFVDSANHIDESTVPNFYASYSQAFSKPFMLAETGIWFAPSDTTTSNTETQVKSAWWQQITAAQTQFPNLKAVTFFDVDKSESANDNPPTQDDVLWSIDDNPATAAAFTAAAAPGMQYATGHACLAPPPVYAQAPVLSPAAAPVTYAAPAPLSAPPAPAPAPRIVQKLVTRCTTLRSRVRIHGTYTYRLVKTCKKVPAPIRRCRTIRRTVRVDGRKVSRLVRVCTLYWPPLKK